MAEGITCDPWAAAEGLGLDPRKSSPGEARIRCPHGCDDGKKVGEYSASMHVAGDEKCGAWTCYKCGESGSIEHTAKQGGVVDVAPKQPWVDARPPAEPINVATGWSALFEGAFRFRRQVERWALDRGWPAELVEHFCRLPDVAWAPDRPTGNRDADRLAEHARRKDRRLLFVLRRADGTPVSMMRRAHATPSLDPKAMIAASGLCPIEGAWILGSLPAWVEAAKAGGVVALGGGEPDFGAAAALALMGTSPLRAVLGSPTAGNLPRLAAEAAAALKDAGVNEARVIVVPHLGDTGPTEKSQDVGEKQMRIAGAMLARDGGALVSTCHLPLDARGKADLADCVERLGIDVLVQHLEEVEPRVVVDDGATLLFGDRIVRIVQTDDRITYSTLAADCWPVALTRTVGEGRHGMRYRHRTKDGRVCHGVLPAAGWVDGASAASEAREAADQGVRIKPRRGADWSFALGTWADTTRKAPMVSIVRRPGWHDQAGRRVYVNGPRVFGADWLYMGDSLRSGRKGSLAAWKAGIEKLATTPTIVLALGVSLAGALLEPMGRPPFILHVAGDSSSGKSLVTLLGASVWWEPAKFLHWESTSNGMEHKLDRYNGACIVLDEMSKMRPKEVANFVHRFSAGLGRIRSNRTGTGNIPENTWCLSCLSSGENTLAEYLGAMLQGGHTVRMIDLRTIKGEAAQDSDHADEIKIFLARQWGHAGDAWIEHLMTLTPDAWSALDARYESLALVGRGQAGASGENIRIARQMAIVQVALEEAQAAGILPQLPVAQTIQWGLERIFEERGEQSHPCARALASLRTLFETQPSRFPSEDGYRDARGLPVVGLSEMVPGASASPYDKIHQSPSGVIFTSETMLKACDAMTQAGTGPRQFTNWCKAQGIGDGGKDGVRAGVRARWHRLDLMKTPSQEAP